MIYFDNLPQKLNEANWILRQGENSASSSAWSSISGRKMGSTSSRMMSRRHPVTGAAFFRRFIFWTLFSLPKSVYHVRCKWERLPLFASEKWSCDLNYWHRSLFCNLSFEYWEFNVLQKCFSRNFSRWVSERRRCSAGRLPGPATSRHRAIFVGPILIVARRISREVRWRVRCYCHRSLLRRLTSFISGRSHFG